MIPDGYAGYVFPRSSMAAKGLVCELPPIDSGYRGEIHAIISNVSSESQMLHKDTRVGQLVIGNLESSSSAAIEKPENFFFISFRDGTFIFFLAIIL